MKIHRATVTHADRDYEGSITIPVELMEAGDLLPNEAVHVWNVTTGTRFETYAVVGERNSGQIAVNGAAAHLAKPGDLVIIAAFGHYPEDFARTFTPTVIFVDEQNRQREIRGEIPGPALASSKCIAV